MRRIPSLKVSAPWFRAVFGGLIGLLAGSLLTALRGTYALEGLELRILDVGTRLVAPSRTPDPRIVVAEILEDDVVAVREALGYSWPWDLEFTASAFQLMADAGVAAVMVDIYHLDRGAGPDDVRSVGEEGDRDESALLLEADQAEIYAEALRKVKNAVLAFELTGVPQYQLPARVKAALPRLGGDLLAGGPDGYVRPGADLPVRRAAEGARVLAFANVPTDADGIVRRAPVLGRWGEVRVLSLALAAATLGSGGTAAYDGETLRLGDAVQATMADGSFLVNFHAEPDRAFPRVSPSQIIDWAIRVYQKGEPLPEEARQRLGGKIVVWGVNLAGIKDIVTAPVGRGAFHGPLYQAAMVDNLLHGDGRVRATPFYNAVVLFLVVGILGLLAGGLQTKWALHVVPLLVILAGLGFAAVRFLQGTAVDVVTPFLGVVLTWGGTTTLHMFTAGRRNRWLEGTFGRYLAPSIIEALKRDPSLLHLGGRRRDLTILFSDVKGFTKISEALSAPQVVTLLNRYLTVHSAAVMEEGGVVDKYMGDGVMAFFGDPVPMERHAEHACRAALQVAARLPSLRPVWEEMGVQDFRVRIGLNTGTAVVGNMGSQERFSYTCMGDSVNLAARLEGANKVFGSTIMIGSGTFEATKELIVARPLAGIVVVGRATPEPVYELLGMRGEAPPEVAALVAAFTSAHEAARRGDLAAARAALEECDRIHAGDGPTAWLRGILGRMERGEIPSPWSGVLVLESK